MNVNASWKRTQYLTMGSIGPHPNSQGPRQSCKPHKDARGGGYEHHVWGQHFNNLSHHLVSCSAVICLNKRKATISIWITHFYVCALIHIIVLKLTLSVLVKIIMITIAT